ncbi:hypothetical protein ABFX02_07G002200 [Erythranthe guttata]
MVVAASMKIEKIREDIELPIIDLLSPERSEKIVKACEEYGFFKVINHGVPQEITTRMEEEAHAFFSKPGSDKLRAGPPNPFGYGFKNIGFNGDKGDVEYLLLPPTNSPHHHHFFSHKSKFISTDPNKFRCAVGEYVAAVRQLASEIVNMIGEGLKLEGDGAKVLSGLINEPNSDSLLRLNHYPCCSSESKIGFGEHTDPQILTLLRSNDVQGLQISLEDGVWVPVTPYPHSAFCVNVGDVLQVGPPLPFFLSLSLYLFIYFLVKKHYVCRIVSPGRKLERKFSNSCFNLISMSIFRFSELHDVFWMKIGIAYILF